MALQNLILPIISLFRSAGIAQASNALRGLSGQFKSLSSQIGMAAGAFGAFSALTTAQQFTVQAVQATSQLERNLLGLTQVFEDASPRIVDFTKNIQDYGLSQSQAAQASVFLGSVLKQYGFSVGESATQTERLVTLAQDLATTYGYDVQEALLAITALFRGEYDPIEKFGVAMKQNEINAELAARGLGDLTGQAEMQAAAQIRLEFLFQRSADAMGAFTRASDTLYGSQQILQATMANLAVAAGAPLQEPLANVNNLFANLAMDIGPSIVQIFEALGGAIDFFAPTIEKVGRAIGLAIGPLQQLINLLQFALGPAFTVIINPALDIFNSAMSMVNELIDAVSDQLALVELGFKRLAASIEGTPLQGVIDAFQWLLDNGFGIGAGLDFLGEQFRLAGERAQVAAGIFTETSSGAKEASSAARRVGVAAREAQNELEALERANVAWTNSWTARAMAYAESIGIAYSELVERSTAFRLSAGSAGTDYVGDFFRGIAEGVRKESARATLERMGASQGLIEAILGASGWEQVFQRVVRNGIRGLKNLQAEFNKTAAGIDEMTRSLEEAEKAQQALRDAAQQMIDDNIANLQRAYDEAKAYFEQVKARAEEFKRWSLDNIATIEILPNFARELGKFEQAIVSTIQGIQSELISAVRSGLIFESDFATLQRWVETESTALIEIARRRDELANRYALSESLIREYQTALTSALRLTSLFSQLKDETETRTVTEVTQGVVKLGQSLRNFNVEVTRSYEETIQKTIDKSEGLVQGFRDIAVRARAFAENLRTLRDMGLDPMLFNQLVEAGVEAGGETAQALVDGGSETITEINGLFEEINRLGAELGMDVGQTMYESGRDMTFGLLDGIKSEQEALLELARSMAQAFSSEFKASLDLAVSKPVAAAEEAMNDAAAAVEGAKEANADLLTDILGLIEGANKALAGPLSSTYRAGVEEKLGIFESLIPDVLSGKVTEIPGLVSGLSTADVKSLVTASGATVSNTFNVNVTADTRTGGAKAGEAVVETLRTYTNQNGSLSTWVTVG